MENEFINQVKEEVTDYGKSAGKLCQLRLTGLVSRILGRFLLIFTIVLLVFALMSFGAVAAIDAMSAYMPVWAAALIMAGIYLLLVVIAYVCRRPLFINPFIKMLSKEISTEEELVMKTVEAEHEMDMQRVRLECHVNEATREVTFYMNLVSRIWSMFKGLKRK